MSDIVNTILPPYAAVTMPQYMRDELKRRDGYNIQYKSSGYKGSSYKNNDILDYQGPMSSWCRVTSNAIVDQKEGFILSGVNGFKDLYGINNTTSEFINGVGYSNVNNATILGYTVDGNPHILRNQSDATVFQKYRTTPGVDFIEVEIRKSIYRRAKIKWKCWSVSQLNYLSKYFFSPYTTVILEWGWNVYNPSSLIDVSNIGTPVVYGADQNVIENPGTGVRGYYTNPRLIEDNIAKSRGCYDAMIGHVINYDYTFNSADLSFDCETEIASNSKYYMGLSMDNVYKNSLKQTPQQSFKEYISTDLKAEILKSLDIKGKNYDLIKTLNVKVAGRIFSPQRFSSDEFKGSRTSNSDKLYISMGLFSDVLNAIIMIRATDSRNSSSNPRKPVDLIRFDIKNTFIGAHPNFIAVGDNFLIPNPFAPYISAENLFDDPDNLAKTPDLKMDESALYSGRTSTKLGPADELLNTVLKSRGRRQDLNRAINYINGGIPKYSFPDSTDLYKGLFENLYVNYDLIIRSMAEKNLKDVLDVICQQLNNDCPVWRLEPVPHPDHPNRITIVDNNYFDLQSLRNSKKDINHNEDLIYYFDAFSQKSILKTFSFTVKLSDAVATMVINTVNSQLSVDSDDKATTNKRFNSFQPVQDRLIGGVDKPNRMNSMTVDSALDPNDTNKDKNARATKLKGFVKNIDEESMVFSKEESTPSGNKKTSIRITLPMEHMSKFQQIIDDNNPLFTNLNSMPVPGTTVEFTLLGIAGFRTFQVFGVKNLPEPYSTKVLFRIKDIKHVLSQEGWITEVSAAIIPIQDLEKLLKNDNTK